MENYENILSLLRTQNLGSNRHQNVDSYKVFVCVDLKYRSNNYKVKFCNTHQGKG